MEQQRLPLIEGADHSMGPTDAASSGSAASAPAATTGVSGTPPRGKGRRTAGSTRPAKGSPGTDWRLDEHTRAVGREGVAAARALLNRDNRAA
ncbi:MAG TPA: hypothetical protein VHU17_09765 [Acidimicrobiales bacterium]|nr:hypothetical protein [Acidimicrobiales bacterium]